MTTTTTATTTTTTAPRHSRFDEVRQAKGDALANRKSIEMHRRAS